MSMSQLERDTLSRLFAVAKTALADLQPRLAGLNEVYNAAGGVKATLDQTDLDELPELSGLQKTVVDDAVYALSNVLTAIDAAYPALAQCAARFL
jgi:hypothetical protein